jgi:hypothetical protein
MADLGRIELVESEICLRIGNCKKRPSGLSKVAPRSLSILYIG